MASSEGRERRYELRVCKAHGRRGCPYPECAERHCETSVEVVPVSALEAVEAERDRYAHRLMELSGEPLRKSTAEEERERREEVESRLRVAVEALREIASREPVVEMRPVPSLKIGPYQARDYAQAIEIATKALASLSDRDEP